MNRRNESNSSMYTLNTSGVKCRALLLAAAGSLYGLAARNANWVMDCVQAFTLIDFNSALLHLAI